VLASEGVNELHVEAGATLGGALWQANLVDELLVYLAPKLLGPGRDMLSMTVLPDMNHVRPLQFTDLHRLGPDLRLRLQVPGAADFLN
jgi:diaminohydroxyphosphoribosylaminopyrimidine deaminase / 5-amino-6-(5-phosphoribosylamino)uracil reductase